MNDYHYHTPPQQENRSGKRRNFTPLYLILLGIFIGVGLTNTFRPMPQKDTSEAPADSAFAQNLPTAGYGIAAFEAAVIGAVKKATPAVVSVHTQASQIVAYRFRDPFFDMLYGKRLGTRPRHGMGSGVIIDPEGIIVTNDHVINLTGERDLTNSRNDLNLTVVLSDGRTYPARILKHFPTQDIAILAVDAVDLPYLELGSSSDLTVGQTVLAIGNPFGDRLTGGLMGGEPTVTRGIISALRRNLNITQEGITRYYRTMLQTDASINEGNSGGALIDLSGKLVGINTAIMSPAGTGSIGIGFAQPSDRVRLILESVRKNSDIGAPFTGIYVQDVTPALAEALDYEGPGGVVIDSIDPESPGEDAGFKKGDIIAKVNGFSTTNREEVVSMFLGSVPGEEFTLSVFRNGKYSDLTLVLGSKNTD